MSSVLDGDRGADHFFARSVHAQFDSETSEITYLPVVQVTFTGCIMTSAVDVQWAFLHLGRRIGEALAPRQRTTTALLVDIATLGVTPDVAPVWGQALREFLGTVCLQSQPGRFLVARYNSLAPFSWTSTPSVMKQAIEHQSFMNHLDANLANNKEEAIQLLVQLRGNSGGFPGSRSPDSR